jgi:hypothetical protein
VEVSPHDGPTPTGTHVWDNNNLAWKNISIVRPGDDDSFAVGAVLGNQSVRVPFLELIVDRSNVPPNVRIYTELVNPLVMQRLRMFIRKREREIGLGCCRFTFLENTRLLIGCPDSRKSGQVILSIPAQSTMELTGTGISPDMSRYDITLGKFKGREVIWIGPRGRTTIPVFAGDGVLLPVIVGGEVEDRTRLGKFEVKLTQVNSEGQPSGGFTVQLEIGE